MTDEPPPPPYTETNEVDENAPPPYTNEQPQQDYQQPQQDYQQPQQDYQQQETNETYQPPQTQETNDYNNQQETNYQQPTSTNGDPEEPEDVVNKPTSDSSSSKWSFGSMEDGDGYFGKRRLRLLTMGTLLTLYSFLAFALWFNSEKANPIAPGITLEKYDKATKTTSFNDGWNLHAAGLFFMFLAFVAVLVLQFLDWRDIFKENKWVNLISAGVMWFGAFLYWVGGMTVAGSYNDLKKNVAPESQTAFAGIAFGEATFIGLLGVALGLDIFLNIQSKSKRVRIYLINGIIFLVGSLILFFSYASVDKKDFRGDKPTYSAYETTAAGWFFILLGIILLAVVEFLLHSNSFVVARATIVWFSLLGVFLFGAFLTAVGYWALCDRKGLRKGSKDAKAANSNLNAYYVGYSFVVLVFAIVMAIDIKFGEFLPGGKDNAAPSDNEPQQTDTENVQYDDPTMEP